MLLRDDELNLDGTVTVPVDCYMTLSQIDYLLWKYFKHLKKAEKEKLLLEAIPNITNHRINLSDEYAELQKNHRRLKNLKIFVK